MIVTNIGSNASLTGDKAELKEIGLIMQEHSVSGTIEVE